MVKIIELNVEESKLNHGLMILIATDENGQKWVVGGEHSFPTYLRKYEQSPDTIAPKPIEY